MSTEAKGLNWYAWAAIFAVFATTMVAYSFYHNDEREEALEILDSIAELQQEVLNNSTNEAGTLVINDVPIDQITDATGDLKAVDLLLRRLTQTEVDLNNEFIQELHSVGFNELFAPATIVQEAGLARSLENILLLKKAVEKHRARYFEFFDGIPDTARESAMLVSTRNHFIKGFEEGYKVKRRLASKRWDNQSGIMDVYESMLRVLEAASGTWTIEKGQMLFDDDRSREMYTRQFEALTQLRADQAVVEQELKAFLQKSIEQTKMKLQ